MYEVEIKKAQQLQISGMKWAIWASVFHIICNILQVLLVYGLYKFIVK